MIAVDAFFIDTNVLIYAHDRSEAVKGPLAKALLSEIFALGRPLLSIQVLAEFFSASTRKIPMPLSPSEAIAEIGRFTVLANVAPLTLPVLNKALDSVTRYSMSFWDAQIFSAAKLANAAFILSEDFQNQHALEGVTFLNPFQAGFDLKNLLATTIP